MDKRKFLKLSDIGIHDERPDVTLFTGTLDGGGAERLQIHLSEFFLAQGRKVDFLVCKPLGELQSLVPDGARLISLDSSRIVLSLPAYLRYLRIAQPHTVISSVERPNIIAGFAKMISKHRHRLFLRVDNTLATSKIMLLDIARWHWLLLVAISHTSADGIIAIAKKIQKQLLSIPWIDADRVLLIYNPVILDDFDERMRHKVERPRGMDDTKPTIIAVGRLHPQKDYSTLLHAFYLVRKQIDCQLLILGEGELRDSLSSLTASLGLSAHVHMPGFVPNVLPFVRNADVYVMSSIWEGLPGALIEALATGTHVVSTDCPTGPSEILDEGRFGELVPVRDKAALAAAISRALKKPKGMITSELSEHLRQFRVDVVGPKYLQLLADR